MGQKRFLYLIFVIVIVFSSSEFCQEKFSYGIKGGVGYWEITSLRGVAENSFTLGFIAGIFLENQLPKNFSLIGELIYQNSITEIKGSLFNELNVYQRFITRYIRVPILLKYQTNWLRDLYFFLGPSFAYLINAQYKNYTDYQSSSLETVTEKVGRYNVSVEAGIGEKIRLFDSSLLFELRGQLSLTKIHPKDFDQNSPVEWRNLGIIFLVGYML